MKLLLVGKPWRGLWLDYVAHAARQQGHEVEVLLTTGSGTADRLLRHVARRISPALWERVWADRAGRIIQRLKPDLVLVVSALIDDSMLAALCERAGRVPVMCWFGDDPSQRTQVFDWIRHGFVTDTGHLNALQQDGVKNTSYLAFAASPAHHFPEPESPEPLHDLVFVANWSKEREAALTPLSGYQVGLYGPDWKRATQGWMRDAARSRLLSLNEWRRLFSGSSLALNVHQRICHNGTNMRSYEILACGGCPLVEHKPDLLQDFVADEEMVLFDGPEQLSEQADRLLADPELQRRIREQGRQRVLSNHTYEHRLQSILEYV